MSRRKPTVGLNSPSKQQIIGNVKRQQSKQVGGRGQKVSQVVEKKKIIAGETLVEGDRNIVCQDQSEASVVSRREGVIKVKQSQCRKVELQKEERTAKKMASPLQLKGFSKTSKIPTLKSSSIKNNNQKQTKTSSDKQSKGSELSLEHEPKAQESKKQSLDNNLSALKQQLQTLTLLNQQIQKEKEKLVKRCEKLNEENKKLLKERIQTFNLEGDSLRKLKDKTLMLNKIIEELTQKINELEKERKSFQINEIKGNLMREQKQTQTFITHDKQARLRIHSTIIVVGNQSNKSIEVNNYNSTSSRNSFGGVLPLETVCGMDDSYQVNLRTAESTPKKVDGSREDRYENYWSVRMGRCEQVQKMEDISRGNDISVKSQTYQVRRYQCKVVQVGEKREGVKVVQMGLDSRQSMGKNGQFSPTVLVDNYRRLSEQEELIRSLYRVVEELEKELQSVGKEKRLVQEENRALKLSIELVEGENQLLMMKVQKYLIEALKEGNPNRYQQQKVVQHDNLLKDETLLLDETREQKQKIDIERDTQQGGKFKQKDNLQMEIRSAIDRHNDEHKIIDEVSNFFYSQFHYRTNNYKDIQKIDCDPGHEQNLSARQQGDIVVQGESQSLRNQIQQKSLLRIDDSLDALEYFSTHTPHNVSSEVSCLVLDQGVM